MTSKRVLIIGLAVPMLSMFILTLGNGFLTTLTTLVLKSAHMSVTWVGLISALYYVGLILGSYFSPILINRVGHIRAFATYAAMISVATLVQGMWTELWVWGVMRLVYGYGLAGLFVLIEGWVTEAGGEDSKGWALSLYLLLYYFGQSGSQLLLKLHFPTYLYAFCLVAVLTTLSIIPISQTRASAPVLEKPELLSPLKVIKQAPLGMCLAFFAGMILSMVYTLQPYFLSLVGLDHSNIAYAMGATILGGALLQLPVGRWSDKVDRRKVIIVMCLLSAVFATGVVLFHQHFRVLLVLLFLMGGSCFTLYPLSMSHTTDYMNKSAIVSAIGILTVAYGAGSVAGPLIASSIMHVFGPYGLFGTIAAVCVFLFFYSSWRVFRREPIDPKKQRHFISAVPTGGFNPEELADQLEIPLEELRKD